VVVAVVDGALSSLEEEEAAEEKAPCRCFCDEEARQGRRCRERGRVMRAGAAMRVAAVVVVAMACAICGERAGEGRARMCMLCSRCEGGRLRVWPGLRGWSGGCALSLTSGTSI
jgi:hypothetical protein